MENPAELEEYLEENIPVPRVIPEMLNLITDNEVIVWEVEISHPVNPAKLRKYAKLWADLDGASGIYDLSVYKRVLFRH